MGLYPGAGIVQDVRARLPCYSQDWRDGLGTARILAPATFIFLASALPAIAFGQQLADSTGGALTVVHVLVSTAISGIAQAVIGGQPLLIIGVAEPIVLIYGFMFSFAASQPRLGAALFLPWASWVCVWTAAMVLLLALANACALIDKFTRFSGELFGFLIAVLFMQVGVKGIISEFGPQAHGGAGGEAAPAPDGGPPPLALAANGLWALILSSGLLLTSLAARRARSWRFLRGWARAALADYGCPLAFVAWTGLSFALAGVPGAPRRVSTPNTWEMPTQSWTVAGRMGDVPPEYIAAALVPAAVISVLFLFDHTVSSQLAQQPEFNLKRPPAYHYDFMLLGLLTLLCGLLGLPPVNGVLPQAPMHTRALATLKAQATKASLKKAASRAALQCDDQAGGRQAPKAGGVAVKATPAQAGAVVGGPRAPAPGDGTGPATGSDALLMDGRGGDGGAVIPVEVNEQRVSGLLQSLFVALCLGLTPAIKLVPTSILWGYFAFMSLESLPGSQFWERLLLLATDPKRRYVVLERDHAAYLQVVPFGTVAAFTLLQLALLLGVWALTTFGGVASFLFPLPIMALVPLRQYLLPRLFRRSDLQQLDAAEYEEAPALTHEAALLDAADGGLRPPTPAASAQQEEAAERVMELMEREYHGMQLVRHVSAEEVRRRQRLARQAQMLGGGGTHGGGGGGAGAAEGGRGGAAGTDGEAEDGLWRRHSHEV